jgi:hypothetical protein
MLNFVLNFNQSGISKLKPSLNPDCDPGHQATFEETIFKEVHIIFYQTVGIIGTF